MGQALPPLYFKIKSMKESKNTIESIEKTTKEKYHALKYSFLVILKVIQLLIYASLF